MKDTNFIVPVVIDVIGALIVLIFILASVIKRKNIKYCSRCGGRMISHYTSWGPDFDEKTGKRTKRKFKELDVICENWKEGEVHDGKHYTKILCVWEDQTHEV